MSPRHGLTGAIGWGIVGAMAAFLAVAVYGLYDWWDKFDLSWGFRDWLRWVVGAAAMPLMGSAAIFACAGWASSAVRPPQRFLVSLLVVFVASIVIWMAVSAMEITPRRVKSVVHPAMYPSEAITFFGAPLLTAVLLTLARRFGGSNPSSRSTNA